MGMSENVSRDVRERWRKGETKGNGRETGLGRIRGEDEVNEGS